MQQVSKEFGHIAQLVGLEAMDSCILCDKCVQKGVSPAIIEQTESCSNQSIIAKKGPLLRATLNNHVDKLFFTSLGNINLGKFVGAFLKGRTRHDGQVNGSTQVDEIGFRHVLNRDSLG